MLDLCGQLSCSVFIQKYERFKQIWSTDRQLAASTEWDTDALTIQATTAGWFHDDYITWFYDSMI